jgi:hypothetical protein
VVVAITRIDACFGASPKGRNIIQIWTVVVVLGVRLVSVLIATDAIRAGPVLGEIVGDSWSVLCPHARQFFENQSTNQNEANMSTEIGFR